MRRAPRVDLRLVAKISGFERASARRTLNSLNIIDWLPAREARNANIAFVRQQGGQRGAARRGAPPNTCKTADGAQRLARATCKGALEGARARLALNSTPSFTINNKSALAVGRASK